MDKTTMVSIDISEGADVVQALERAQIKVSVALWAFLGEFEDWRLVIAARQFDTADPRDAYRLLFDSLRQAEVPMNKTPTIMILPTRDPFVREIRRLFRKTRSSEGMRLSGQLIDDRFVQDAYVYRIG